jgi:hypothetical protein
MKSRDLSKLIQTPQLQEFAKEFQFKIFLSDGQIFLKKSCLIINIHGEYAASCLIFDCYDIKIDKKSSFGVLVSEMVNEDMKNIYKHYKETHKEPICDLIHPNNYKMAVDSEVDFLLYLEIAKKYLSELLNCHFENYTKYFQPTREMEKENYKFLLT